MMRYLRTLFGLRFKQKAVQSRTASSIVASSRMMPLKRKNVPLTAVTRFLFSFDEKDEYGI